MNDIPFDFSTLDEPLKPKRSAKAKPPSELDIQTLFRSRARMRCPRVRIVAVPNAAIRGQKAMNQARREGAAWGFPDVICMWPGRGVAFIEFKAEKGRLDPRQEAWLDQLSDMGFPATVARDPDEALRFLADHGAPFMVPPP
jgi:hypothetical protein